MKIEELKRLAEAATPGPWRAGSISRGCTINHRHGVGECVYDRVIHFEDDHQIIQVEKPFTEIAGTYDYDSGGIIEKKDQLYIAATSPDVVLELISQIERLKAEAELFAKHIGFKNIGIKLARKDALLRECLPVLSASYAEHYDEALKLRLEAVIRAELGEQP